MALVASVSPRISYSFTTSKITSIEKEEISNPMRVKLKKELQDMENIDP